MMHQALIDEFGGSHGIRDEGLLESALAAPQSEYFGVVVNESVYDQAAAYLYHLIKNHPFVDGNKRVAYAAMRTFLGGNGYHLDLSQDAKYEMVMDVAESKISKEGIAKALQNLIVRT